MPPDNSVDEYDIFFQNLEQQVGRCSVDVPSSDDEGGSSDDADSTQVVDPAGIDVNTLSADDEVRRNCLTLMRDVSLKDDICRALGFTLDTSWVLRRNRDGGQAGHLRLVFDGSRMTAVCKMHACAGTAKRCCLMLPCEGCMGVTEGILVKWLVAGMYTSHEQHQALKAQARECLNAERGSLASSSSGCQRGE